LEQMLRAMTGHPLGKRRRMQRGIEELVYPEGNKSQTVESIAAK